MTGVLLVLLAVVLSHVPTLAAAALTALCVAAAFVQPGVMLLAAAAIALLMLTWQKSKNTVSAASFLLVGVIVAGVAAISLQTGTMQALSENAKDTLHHWRYEKVEELLPEGDLSEPVTKTESTDTILSVTADTAQALYLRGFVGDSYENGVWSALDAETAAEEKDLFYWLHQSGFYPQSQLATAARLMGNYQSGSVSVQNLTGCSLYRYEPCTILPERAGLAKTESSRPQSKRAVCAVNAGIPMRRFRMRRRCCRSCWTFAKRHIGQREIVLTDGKRVPGVRVFLCADRACGVPRAARRGAG